MEELRVTIETRQPTAKSSNTEGCQANKQYSDELHSLSHKNCNCKYNMTAEKKYSQLISPPPRSFLLKRAGRASA